MTALAVVRDTVGTLATALRHERGENGKIVIAVAIVVVIVIVVAVIWWNGTDGSDSNDD